MDYYRDIVTGKNKQGVDKLNTGLYELPDEDIFCEAVSDTEYDYIMGTIAPWALDEFGIIIDDFDFDEIDNEQVEAFLEKIGNDKDKAPCLYKALTTAKDVGGSVQICF